MITFFYLDCAAAEAEKQFTLKDAILIALRFNSNIRSAELQRIMDKFNLTVAKNRYELNYALTGSAQAAQNRTNGYDSSNKSLSLTPGSTILLSSGATASISMNNNVSQQYYNPGLTLTVKQPLMRGFGREITLSPLADAYDNEKINRLRLKQTVINTVTVIIIDYLRIVQDQNSLTTQQLALKNAIKEYEQNKIKIKAGKMAAADNTQQAGLIANQRLGILQAENNLKTDKLQLLTDMGLDPDTPFRISKDITLGNEIIPDLTAAKKLMVSNDIDYQISLINRRIQERNFLLAKDRLRWKLDATVTTTVGNGSGGGSNSGIPSLLNNQNYNRAIQLDLEIPIDNKPLQQAVVNAKIHLQQTDIQLQQQKMLLETHIINMLRSLAVQKQQIQQAITARDLAQKSLDIALKKLQFGLVSTFETTILSANLTAAELQVVNSQANYLSALANLQQTLGTTLDMWGIAITY